MRGLIGRFLERLIVGKSEYPRLKQERDLMELKGWLEMKRDREAFRELMRTYWNLPLSSNAVKRGEENEHRLGHGSGDSGDGVRDERCEPDMAPLLPEAGHREAGEADEKKG